MQLINKKSIYECESDNEIDEHYKEMEDVYLKIIEYKDYTCALLCKYQDEYHKREEMKIYGCKISEINDEIERFDYKNGVDMYIDEDGYLTLLIHGQGYTYKGKYHTIEMGVKILPMDEKHNFIDISNLIFGLGEPEKSTNQY